MSQSFSIPFADAADFLDASQNLLPDGDAWTTESNALLTTLLSASTASLARVHARAADLTERENLPWTAVELLPDWEAAYGLPDPCTPPNPSIQQRQAALKARVAASGGQSPDYFIEVGAGLGYTITIDELQPVRFESARFGALWFGAEYQFVWRVNVTNAAKFPARFGLSRFGDTYVSYSGQQLTCVLNRIKPAHTILIMNYEGS